MGTLDLAGTVDRSVDDTLFGTDDVDLLFGFLSTGLSPEQIENREILADAVRHWHRVRPGVTCISGNYAFNDAMLTLLEIGGGNR